MRCMGPSTVEEGVGVAVADDLAEVEIALEALLPPRWLPAAMEGTVMAVGAA